MARASPVKKAEKLTKEKIRAEISLGNEVVCSGCYIIIGIAEARICIDGKAYHNTSCIKKANRSLQSRKKVQRRKRLAQKNGYKKRRVLCSQVS